MKRCRSRAPGEGDSDLAVKMGARQVASWLVLLCFISGRTSSGAALDVCASCHVNATCDHKPNGSGKECNCRYGFVGNGLTFCLDKDECQLGARRICGPHTTCHNTFGSYYCTCLEGYSPTNNMNSFIPNDGSKCQDIDECRVEGLCGRGALCTNLEGSFECRCQLGFTVFNGREPFHPQKDLSTCREVSCGPPLMPYNSTLWSATGTSYGDAVTLVCEEGFLWRGGDNTSVCGADGHWSKPSIICEEILCGAPPLLPHAEHDVVISFTPGSTATYRCQTGFDYDGGDGVALCNTEGSWTEPNISCSEVNCGAPPEVPHSLRLWDLTSTVGSQALYQCVSGYHSEGGPHVSYCSLRGVWEPLSLLCREVDCQPPAFIPNSKRLWDGTSHLNSEVHYQCEEGFVTRGLRNYSRCGADGTWEDVDLVCEEISCGPPPTPPHTNLLWDGATRPASMAMYECVTGLYHASGAAVSTCLTSGQWTDVSVVCKAKCGPVPGPAHSEVVWQNTTVAVHRCVLGFRSWRGHDTSVCSSTGVWLGATLHCVAVQPAISHLSLAGEKCLRWQAGRHGGDSEMYKVTYVGSRDFDLDFHDTGKQFLRSKSSQVQVCLNLLPVANYTVYVSAVSAKLTVAITTNTSLTVPSPPTVYYKEYETPVPTLSLRRSPDSLDSISVYQVFVLPVGDIMVFDCWSPEGPNSTWAGYITAVIQVGRVKSEYNFTVGDGRWYGGYYNTPLEEGHSYYILLRVQSRWKRAVKSSCVLWAKVKGTSYVLKLSLLCAAACVVLLSLLALGGYFHLWCVHFRL
ncbi:sushi domain-containing protein 1 isoform X4 [Synchiropus splendidus]|uniref:sushi domain-containing protein 1 isoform X4 n=1 Tax=Synchiropus splendidus TaxID=270530 RepID=UPI00237E0C56|nr:sushi domain-containing protein 1 isoform X4 [Synchiropus splendidus]